MNFPDKILNSKVILFGEIHGTSTAVDVKIELVKQLIEKRDSLLILLERPFNEAAFYREWSEEEQAPIYLKNKFIEPKTSLYSKDEYRFLEFLLVEKFSNAKLKVFPVDISFDDIESNELEVASKKIKSILDEDEFDLEREKFIIDRISKVESEMNNYDCVVFFAGNMHVSKSNMYFSLRDEGERHIDTSGMYLSDLYDTESIFCYPRKGKYRYQSNGQVMINEFGHHEESHIRKSLPLRDDQLEDVTIISNGESLDKNFSRCYDWTMVLNNCKMSSGLK